MCIIVEHLIAAYAVSTHLFVLADKIAIPVHEILAARYDYKRSPFCLYQMTLLVRRREQVQVHNGSKSGYI